MQKFLDDKLQSNYKDNDFLHQLFPINDNFNISFFCLRNKVDTNYHDVSKHSVVLFASTNNFTYYLKF